MPLQRPLLLRTLPGMEAISIRELSTEFATPPTRLGTGFMLFQTPNADQLDCLAEKRTLTRAAHILRQVTLPETGALLALEDALANGDAASMRLEELEGRRFR